MNLLHSRTIKSILIAAIVFTIFSLRDLLFEIAGDDIREYLQAKGIRPTTFVFTLIVVLLVCVLIAIHKAVKNKSDKEEPEIFTGNIEPDVKKFFDSLKERYQRRYEQKLDGRFEITLEVSKDWDSRRPQVIKEKFSRDANVGEAIENIYKAFTDKGSLLIVGNPGAGKTVLLLKLAVSLLDQADISKKDAFPVIFNLASWSSEYERFEDWLKATLESGYGLSKKFASTLLHQERIILLLDGLDEMARDADEKLAAQKRGECLQSLNQYLSRGKKVVICCRRNEFLQIRKLKGRDAPVAAKVALLDLTKDQIENALSDAARRTDSKGNKIDSTSANHILEYLKLKRSKILLDVLRTPFYFTTALEVFDKPILDDMRIPNRPDELRRYLLSKFIETKLYRTPNPNKFKPQKTRKWLEWLAIVSMSKRQITFELTDLQLYHLEIHMLYAFFTSIFFGAVTEFFVLGMLGKSFWGVGFPIGSLSILLAASFGIFRRLIVTEDIKHWDFLQIFRWMTWKKWLKAMLIISAALGAFASLLIRTSGTTILSPIRAFLFVALMGLGMLVIQISIDSSKRISFYTHLKRPYQRLTAGISFTVTKFSIIGVIMSLLVMYELHQTNITVVVFGGLLSSFTGFMTTPLFRHLILRLCLSIEGKMPLKYATFLDYAAEARILEKDGGHWRFRHQNLQDYFARFDF